MTVLPNGIASEIELLQELTYASVL